VAAVEAVCARTAAEAVAAVLARYPRRDQADCVRSSEAKKRRRVLLNQAHVPRVPLRRHTLRCTDSGVDLQHVCGQGVAVATVVCRSPQLVFTLARVQRIAHRLLLLLYPLGVPPSFCRAVLMRMGVLRMCRRCGDCVQRASLRHRAVAQRTCGMCTLLWRGSQSASSWQLGRLPGAPGCACVLVLYKMVHSH